LTLSLPANTPGYTVTPLILGCTFTTPATTTRRWGGSCSPTPSSPTRATPKALNRYSYVLNAPVKYTDPSGFDPIDAGWEQEFYRLHGRAPTDQDRRDRFFSILFAGSGPNGSWTDADWARYSANRLGFWNGSYTWQGAPAAGLDRFVAHLQRLASHYAPGEESLYAQAIGFIWGGVPLGSVIRAAWHMATNPGAAWARYEPLFEGTARGSAMKTALVFIVVVASLLVLASCTVLLPQPTPQRLPTPAAPPELQILPRSAHIGCTGHPDMDPAGVSLWELPGITPSDPDSAYRGDRGNWLGALPCYTEVTATDYAWSDTDREFYVYVRAQNGLEGWVPLSKIDLMP